jgi:anti-anti-sigma regulatory factor
VTHVALTQTDGYTVAALSGQLTLDDDALLAELAGLLSEQPDALIVDLTDLSVSSSDTLQVFGELERMARQASVPLGFAGA